MSTGIYPVTPVTGGGDWVRNKREEALLPTLFPVEHHAYLLHQILEAHDLMSLVGGASASDWLFLAAGLSEVRIATDILESSASLCANVYESDRGKAMSIAAKELTRVLFVWGAVESLKRSLKAANRSPKGMCSLIAESAPAFRHNDCAARALLSGLEADSNEEFKEVATKAANLDFGVIGRATWAAYQVRNSLAHGSIIWPDDDYAAADRVVRIADATCRVLLFAAQRLVLLRSPADARTVDWPENEDKLRKRLIADVLPSLHLFE